MNTQYLVYSILVVSTCAVCVQSAKDQQPKKRVYRITDKIRRCSVYLSNLVADVCDNKFTIIKRDTTSVLVDKLRPKDLQDHMNKRRLDAAQRERRVRRQIATECCEKPCNIENLISYCTESARLVQERPELFDFATSTTL